MHEDGFHPARVPAPGRQPGQLAANAEERNGCRLLPHISLPARGTARGTAVLLHGLGADEHDLLGVAATLPHHLQRVSLRAPLPLPWGGYAWYPLRTAPGGASLGIPWPEGVSEAGGLAAAVAAVRATCAALPTASHPLLLGFSQGAAVAAATILAAPAEFAGCVLLSGFLPAGSAPGPLTPGFPAFVAHGTEDPLLPVAEGRRLRDQLQAAGAAVAYHEYALAHGIGDEELDDLVAWLPG